MNNSLGPDEAILGGVLEQFFAICRYPHPSWGEAALCGYVEGLLRSRGLEPVRDGWNNLMADVPATPGREQGPLLIVQGHLDMVCAVKPDSGYDPNTSPVTPVVENGVLRSDGRSSLGADNNLGNAAVLWLLGQDVPHGPVRLLFTAAEEVGLQGAARVDPAWLAGAKFLLNTDGFSLGRAVVSSAGGLRETFTQPLTLAPRRKSTALTLALTGFPGGHSGYDIGKGRPNPIRLLAEFLGGEALPGYELLELNGGHAHNAIPMDCAALIAVDEGDVSALEGAWADFLARTAPQYGGDWGEGTLTRQAQSPDRVWTDDLRRRVLDALNALEIGVSVWLDRAAGQVSASANLGAVKQTEGGVEVSCFIRCACREDEAVLSAQHRRAMEGAGFAVQSSGYPGWPERSDNPLADALTAVWRELTGAEMALERVHVGLEPSIFGDKNRELCMVSTGPDILDPHSIHERAPLKGLPRYVRLLAGTLEKLSR
jgi:dipeptidase D